MALPSFPTDTRVKAVVGSLSVPSVTTEDSNVAAATGNIASAMGSKVANGTDACLSTSNTASISDTTSRILATVAANRDILNTAARKVTVAGTATDGASSKITDDFVLCKDSEVTNNAIEGAAAASEEVSRASAATGDVSRAAKWMGIAIAGVIIPTLCYVAAICFTAATKIVNVVLNAAADGYGSFLAGITVGDMLPKVGEAKVGMVHAPVMKFGDGGIAEDSIAAGLQSGHVAAGNLFAALQSAGAVVGAAVAYFF